MSCVDNSVHRQLKTLKKGYVCKPPSGIAEMVELQTELQTYRDRLPSMLDSHNGQYVVIKGAKPVDFFPTYNDALEWAYERFGLEQFFVKKVAEDQDVAHFTRDLGPCRS